MYRKTVSIVFLVSLIVGVVSQGFLVPDVHAADTIIDTHVDSRFTKYPSAPYWWSVSDHDVFHTRAYNNNFWYTYCNAPGVVEYFGTWTAMISGQYEVFVWIPNPDAFGTYTPTQSANYQIYHQSGMTWKTVNQRLRTGGWYSLGSYTFGTSASVILNDNTGEPYASTMIAFDAIRFVNVDVENPPYTPSYISPWNGESGVSTSPILSWSGGDPDPGDTVTYDVYFGPSSSPPLVSSGQSATTYSPGILGYSTTYYWKIVSTDNHGLSTSGSIWYFTTQFANQLFALSNGYVSPASGDTSTAFSYYVTYSDPEGDIPTTKYVYIDGSAYALTKISGDYISGAVFCYSTTLSAGTHNYYYYFADSVHSQTRNLPTSGTYSGPTVSQAPSPDFSISAFPNLLAIQPGSSDSSTITIGSINGFSQPVSLSVSAPPSGITASLIPSQVTPPAGSTATSTLTVSAAITATPGSYTLTVTGISGTLTHSAYISLEVISPTNGIPDEPENSAQLVDGINLNIGATTAHRSIEFRAKLSDPDGDRVRLQVELRNLQEYGGQFNEAADNFKESPLVQDGGEASSYADEMIDESYHWRARTVDEHGFVSNWVEFGGNDISEADFIVQTASTGWTFAVISDLHIGREYNNYIDESYYLTLRLEEVVNRIKLTHEYHQIKFVVVLGDLTENGKQNEMVRVREILDRLNEDNIPYFPVIGNHDLRNGDSIFDSLFDDVFFNDQCGLLGVPWENGRTTDAVGRMQNYAFEYEGKRFVFLDFIDRSWPYAQAIPYLHTFSWLETQLQKGDPTFLFSHHPMIEDTWTAFGDIDPIREDITAARNSYGTEVLANFAGHIHGYYDSSKKFLEHSPASAQDALSLFNEIGEFLTTPVFLNANCNYYEEGFATPANIPVITTEAMMVGSNEPTEKGVITVVFVGNNNEFVTYEEGIFPSLNPSLKVSIDNIADHYHLWVEHQQLVVDFECYAFTKMFSDEQPITYSLFVNGVLIAPPVESSFVRGIVFPDYVLDMGTYEVTLTVEGWASDGSPISESVQKSVTVAPFVASVQCPVDISVTDPSGHTISAQVNEIPDATYAEVDLDGDGDLDYLVLILDPIEGDYVITLNGTDREVYGITTEMATLNGLVNFTATDIPVSSGEVHQYAVNWNALYQGEKGVTVEVDSNGDNVFECNFTSDSELSRFEYVAATTGYDLGINEIAFSKNIVSEGYFLPINTTVTNYGIYPETFNLAIYANDILLATRVVMLANATSTTVAYDWNTTGFAKGNYTISVFAEPVLNETYVADNNATCIVPVHVGVPGDVSSSAPGVYDAKCDMKDIAYLVILFNTRPSSSNWNPNADVDNNGVVNMIDIAIAIAYFNQHE